MFGGSGELVKAPNQDQVEFPFTGVSHEFVKLRARVFRPGLADVDVFADDGEASSGPVCSQVTHLHLTALILGAHPRIDSYSHTWYPRALVASHSQRLFCSFTTISLRAILSTKSCGVVRKKRVQRPLQADALKNRTHARVGYFFAVIRVFSINLSLLHCCGRASPFI